MKSVPTKTLLSALLVIGFASTPQLHSAFLLTPPPTTNDAFTTNMGIPPGGTVGFNNPRTPANQASAQWFTIDSGFQGTSFGFWVGNAGNQKDPNYYANVAVYNASNVLEGVTSVSAADSAWVSGTYGYVTLEGLSLSSGSYYGIVWTANVAFTNLATRYFSPSDYAGGYAATGFQGQNTILSGAADFQSFYTTVAVPEPAAVLTVILGITCILLVHRRARLS